jgi:hypothetical protein
MSIHVGDVPRLQARLAQRARHGQLGAAAVGWRLRDVVRIARQAIATHLKTQIFEVQG